MNEHNIKSKEVEKILVKEGFVVERQEGSHVVMRKGERTVVVPVHHEIMPIGTLKAIEKESGIIFRDEKHF
jgi:predicted RNA binding protein YcfA (HicA-like mRNA interferase family)